MTVDDQNGGMASRSFAWEVSGNTDPVIDPIAGQTSDEGDAVSLAVTASDDDGDTLVYAATGLPEGLAINASTGVVFGDIAQTAATGSPYPVEVTVDDGKGGSAGVTFTWTVDAVNLDPVIDPVSDRNESEGETVLVTVEAADPDGDTLAFTASGLPEGLAIDPATGEISGAIAVGAAAGSPYLVEVAVDDQAGGSAATTFSWAVTSGPSRVSEGLVVLYEFGEGAGSVVGDSSGVGVPLDLSVADPGSVSWSSGGLSVDAATVISSGGPATKVADAVGASGELTVEAWVDPAEGEQSGPARIVSSSLDPFARNFLLGQGAWGSLPDDVFAARVRSGLSVGGTPTVFSPSGSVSGGLSHVVLTRAASGVRTLFVDGVAVSSDTRGGSLANWDRGFPLSLANTADGTRPWRGEFRLVSIYGRALDGSEVEQNHQAGPDGDAAPPNAAPVAVATASPESGDAPLDVSLDGSGSSDPDGSVAAHAWDFGDGESTTGASVTHTFSDPGTYTVTLTVTDDVGATASDTVTVTVDPAPFGPTIVTQPVDITVVEGQTAVFEVAADGDPSPTYQWYRDGVPIPGATDSSVELAGVSSADDGIELFVEVSGHDPTVTSDTVALTVVEAGATPWWSADHPGRVPISVAADGVALHRRVALVDTDLGSVLGGGALNRDSLRLVEHDASGAVVDPAVPFQFDPGPGFDPMTNPVGTLAILLTGTTPGSGERTYHLYLDVVGGNPHLPPPVAPLVGPTELTVDEGQTSYRIPTEIGDWYYHEDGGGFSSLNDVDGNDWIGYRQGGGSSGEFRGIPNLVYPQGHFHPGATSATTRLIDSGPLRTSLESTTADGWAVRWDLFPTFATATVLTAPSDYWFLYEGTPGGQVEEATDTVTRSDGTTTPLSQAWSLDLPGSEWAYFTDGGVDRSLFVVSHEDDAATDSYRTLDGAMTVFGLGRDGLTSGLAGAPRSFSVGLVDGNGTETELGSAAAPLSATVGAAEFRVDSSTDPTAVIAVDTNLGDVPLAVAFDAAGSSDPDGSIVGYQWDFGDGATASGAAVTHQYATAGHYEVTLSVVDDAGNSGVDHVGVVAGAGILNTAPLAMASATPTSGAAPLQVTFDGSGSTDAEGPLTGHTWAFGDGAIATGVTATHTYEEPGTYTASLTVTDGDGLTDTDTVIVRALGGPSDRVEDGLIALYEFTEGQGDLVRDTSGFGPPLDLVIADSSRTDWVPSGLRLSQRTTVASVGPATKLRDAVSASDEVTLEAWVDPADLDQNGPARVVTLSANSGNRNLTLGQGVYNAGSDRVEVRLRTSTSNSNGQPATATPAGSLPAGLAHLLYTRAADGSTAIYVDGQLRATGQATGTLDNWGDYRLALGNEFDAFRSWLGTYLLVGFYDRALSPAEVTQNYDAAPNGDGTYPNVAPVVQLDTSSLVGPAPLRVDFDASASSDADGSIDSIEWDFGDGGSDSGPTATHEYANPGVYTATVTVTDDGGAAAEVASTVVVLATDLSNRVEWTRLSSDDGDLEPPGTQPDQTVALTGDLSGDGVDDFVIGSRFGTEGPTLVWYERTASGWTKHVIEPDLLNVEAGGALHDIDGDGDLDLVVGEDSTGRRLWWWENPGSDFDAAPWTRRVIKDGGNTQHHDQVFGDVDGDGQTELVFWNNRGQHRLYVADLPADPTVEPWPATVVFTPPVQSEGLAVTDVNGDGTDDIVGGGYWFEHVVGGTYAAHEVDAAMAFTRVVVGDLIEGGRPEMVFDSGDEVGELLLYEWNGSLWTARTLLADSAYGHSLNVGDINEDGYLDLVSGEMHFPTNPDPVLRVLYGDGAGGFVVDEVASGIGNHESKLADLDGDGDLDILGKPFREGVPGLNIWLNEGPPPVQALDQWSRHVADDDVPWRTVFVEHGDVDGDGLEDVLAGGWWWRNPGTVSGAWARLTIGSPLNQLAAVADFDGDGDLDVLGTEAQGSQASSDFHWAENDGSGGFTIHDNVASATGTFLQGVTVAEFTPGTVEIALSWQVGAGGLQMLTVPDPASITTAEWTWRRAHPLVSGEGLDHGDIDDDGDLDILDGGNWFRNDGGGTFTRMTLHVPLVGEPDRNRLFDMDDDGDLDAVIGYGHDTEGKIAWYEQGVDPETTWTEHLIDAVAPPQAQSLDVADLDGDGDLDVVMGEHANPAIPGLRAVVYENVGAGAWITHEIHSGDEHHDGTQLVDLDLDGDLDVVSVGWTHRNLLIYENTSTN